MRWVALLLSAVSSPAYAIDIGQPAPEIDLPSLSGQHVRLSALRGKVVIVEFWATWCEPCRENLQQLEVFYRAMGPQGLEVLAVSVDDDRSDIESFTRPLGLTFRVLHDNERRAADLYAPAALPAAFVIDRSGQLRYVHEGAGPARLRALQEQVQKLLRSRPRDTSGLTLDPVGRGRVLHSIGTRRGVLAAGSEWWYLAPGLSPLTREDSMGTVGVATRRTSSRPPRRASSDSNNITPLTQPLHAGTHRIAPSRDEVARRAYEIWQQNGCEHGHEADHWIRAEQELSQTHT